jgi:ABC-type dipeptide/oligopeptide/nickel transport system ATPase subunit
VSGLINRIRLWASTDLAYWERATLEKLARGDELVEADFREILRYFLQDVGLESIPTDRPPLSFPDHPAGEPPFNGCHLERLLSVTNVNALPDGQEILFGPQITIVYGNNGVGKTGYARILGSAAFARGDREVLPNVNQISARAIPHADIEVSTGDTTHLVSWNRGERCPELAGFYAFDGGSLVAHLTRSNPLNFCPGGLSLLTRLADATDKIRERLRQLADARDRDNDFSPLFDGVSEVSKYIVDLGADTDLRALENLARLSADEESRIATLEREIAELTLLNVRDQSDKLRREMEDLKNLIASIERAQAALGDGTKEEVKTLADEVAARRSEVEQSGVNQFTFEHFTQIGSPTWQNFLIAAKELADAEERRGSPYPNRDDYCLLCRQPLASEALELIQRIWTFLKSDSQTRLEAAELACANKAREIERVTLGYLAPDSNVRRLLEAEIPSIIAALEAQIEAYVERREEMVGSLHSYLSPAPPPLIDIDLIDLRRLVKVRESGIEFLASSDSGQRLAGAEQSLLELKHRKILAHQFNRVTSFVGQKKWAMRARQSIGSTMAITKKYNELFRELVTEQYTALFEETLRRFKDDMRVKLETRGLKGETVRQITLSSNASGCSVDRVLSDGEKRAVAMADFLTEVTMDQSSNGIVLDDPVTSFDNSWKDTLALCLAELAKTRQVIIFTHDLSFIYHLKTHAEEQVVDVVTHWIRAEDGKPGYVYLNNSPTCEKDFRSAALAREYYSKAKTLEPSDQQAALQQGFGALRTSYEALIVFEIFNNVVGRFDEVISFGRLSQVRIDESLLNEVVDRMEKISRYINAHLHSDEFASVKPTPETLRVEIEAFEVIRNRQRQLKKATGSQANS